jgi:glycine dehydrogenase subunit 2
MKYNPKLNERVARLEGFANAHPYTPVELVQGALEVQKMLETCLAEITGMNAVTLQPAAGAHGELTGILMIRAYHESKGRSADSCWFDSAHGTNRQVSPSPVTKGFEKSRFDARTGDLARLKGNRRDDVAAIMIGIRFMGYLEMKSPKSRHHAYARRPHPHGQRASECHDELSRPSDFESA